MKILKGKHIAAILFVICLCAALAGCGEEEASSAEASVKELTSAASVMEITSVEESIPESDLESSESQVSYQIANIKFYEITENNFQDGLYYNFSEDEIVKWQDLISSVEDVSQVGELEKEDTKYIVELYDSCDANVGYYRVDEDLHLYSEDGYKLESDEIAEMLSEIIEANGNQEI